MKHSRQYWRYQRKMSDESTASFLDKTDWRKTIHKLLENAVAAKGTIYYSYAVDRLIDAVAAEYPGFNAELEIRTTLDRLEKKYSYLEHLWLELNPTKRKAQKYIFKKKLKTQLSHDMYEFIKNLCARKRMLLWGTKKIEGGTQIEYVEGPDD